MLLWLHLRYSHKPYNEESGFTSWLFFLLDQDTFLGIFVQHLL